MRGCGPDRTPPVQRPQSARRYGAAMTFSAQITVTGPLRSPAQMLADQVVDGHTSIHDGDAAAALGLKGAPIEGPTHFSQFDPLAFVLWGTTWFEQGCISSHFRTMVVEGEQVQASIIRDGDSDGHGDRAARIEAHKHDGTPVLVGTASVGPDHPQTALEQRLASQGDAGELFIIDRLHVGMTSHDDEPVSMSFDEPNGLGYPFSLNEKLPTITEPHAWYTAEGARTSPWGRPIIPVEMISVLANRSGRGWPVRSPAFGLFLDLEIRLLGEPLFVDARYRIES